MLSGLARLIFSGSIVPSISKAPHLCANENEVSDERLIFGKENGAVPAVGLLSVYCLWQFHSLSLQLHSRILRASLSDVISNVLLFVPFGILCVWVETASDQRRRMVPSTLLTSIYGLLFGVIIESGQTLSPWRSPSQLDVLCNGFGAFFGALGGFALVRAFRESLRIGLVQVLRDQPSLLVLGYLLLGVFVDSYYPFGVTLDRSTLWNNLKQSEFIPFKMFVHRYWLELLIEKVAVFAAIGYLRTAHRVIRSPEKNIFADSPGLCGDVSGAGSAQRLAPSQSDDAVYCHRRSDRIGPDSRTISYSVEH